MKKIVFLILMVFYAFMMSAQKGLNVAPYFGPPYDKDPHVSMVSIAGRSLQKYHLDVYKSIEVTNDAALVSKLEAAVSADGSKAVDKEVTYKGGRLSFGFYTLAPSGNRNRYLVYMANPSAAGGKVTLIYMAGEATRKQILSIMKK